MPTPTHSGLAAQDRELAALRSLMARRPAPTTTAPHRPTARTTRADQLLGYPVLRGGRA